MLPFWGRGYFPQRHLPMPADELTLYADLCADDPRLVERATRLLTRQVRAIALKVVLANSGTIHDVDDLVQEVVVAVWRQARDGSYRPQTDVPMGAFLFRVVRNNWLKVLRQRRQQGPTGELDAAVAEPQLPEDARLDSMQRAFARLGVACQQLLRLFYWEGYRLDEIAGQLDISASAAKERKYRCMLTLGTLLLGNKRSDAASAPDA